MAKFTVILEFRGGTYIRQLRATSPRAALKKLGGATESHARAFRELSKGKPVPIRGIDNCWCTSSSVGRHFALVNVVKTGA